MVVFLKMAASRPAYAILTTRCVDEVAFGFSAAGFGAACVLRGGVDNHDGAMGKAVDGARSRRVSMLKLPQGIPVRNFFM